jgi:AraC family transcriptional regulator
MRVGVNVIKSEVKPRISVRRKQVLAMMLQPGSYESGLRRSEMTRHECYAGQLILCHRGVEVWIRRGELHVLNIVISDAALRGANDGKSGEVEFRNSSNVVDSRIAALVMALNAERVAGFPTGQLSLDSVEQALALVLVERYAVRRPSLRGYRGGLSPAHLRKVTDLVHTKMEEELTLREMAQSVELSISHFSEMFRTSTGETPHQFVLRQRIERAKEMLRAAEARVLDVAIACGFKTQQHFARVFRRFSGVSPTEYRQEHNESERSDPRGRSLDTTCVL